MTYQLFAKRIIQIAITLMLVLLAWISYHKVMGMMPMESMDNCATLCLIAEQVNTSALVQSVYYSFVSIAGSVLALLTLNAIATALLYLKYNLFTINPVLQRLRRYYHQQRWQFRLWSLWPQLYQQGIIAPQIYS